MKFEVSLHIQMLTRVGRRTLRLTAANMWVVFETSRR